jgi:hypothetical protein
MRSNTFRHFKIDIIPIDIIPMVERYWAGRDYVVVRIHFYDTLYNRKDNYWAWAEIVPNNKKRIRESIEFGKKVIRKRHWEQIQGLVKKKWLQNKIYEQLRRFLW